MKIYEATLQTSPFFIIQILEPQAFKRAQIDISDRRTNGKSANNKIFPKEKCVRKIITKQSLLIQHIKKKISEKVE
jgi:hypothetical protein